jgi:TctA family transporter
MIESSMRQSLLMSGGSFLIFLERPISMALMGTFAVLAIAQAAAAFRKKISK